MNFEEILQNNSILELKLIPIFNEKEKELNTTMLLDNVEYKIPKDHLVIDIFGILNVLKFDCEKFNSKENCFTAVPINCGCGIPECGGVTMYFYRDEDKIIWILKKPKVESFLFSLKQYIEAIKDYTNEIQKLIDSNKYPKDNKNLKEFLKNINKFFD